MPLIADHGAAVLADFVSGANAEGFHYTGVNWGRDAPEPAAADLRNVVSGDPSPGGGTLTIARGIEVGHIFQLGDKYSKAMNAVVLDQDGKERVMIMGCYGIGVSRIVAAAIEQNHDEPGIVWPDPMSPFDVTVLVLNPKNSRARHSRSRGSCTYSCSGPVSRFCWTIATPVPASSSRKPICWAFRTGSWWANGA